MCPRTADQNEALRAATRSRLLGAALLLFARDGYTETSIKAVAREAGVATGLLYSHFEGKEGLLRALFEQSMADVRASFASADQAPVGDRLRALVLSSVDIVRRHFDFWRLGYATRSQPAVVAVLRPHLEQWSAGIVAILTGYLAETGSEDPSMDAAALFAQIDGICQHYALDPEGYPVDAVAERVIARWSAFVEQGERR